MREVGGDDEEGTEGGEVEGVDGLAEFWGEF